MENNSVLFNFIECIKVRPEDRLLSFWIKRIMWIVTSLSFVYAYIIGAYRSVFFLGICVFFWTLDCTFTREKIYLYLDIVCMTMVTAAVCTIVLSGEMQQYAAFMSLVTGVMSIFILGLIWGSFFAVLNVLFIVATFSLDMGDIINVAYPTVFKERFPYMMVCF